MTPRAVTPPNKAELAAYSEPVSIEGQAKLRATLDRLLAKSGYLTGCEQMNARLLATLAAARSTPAPAPDGSEAREGLWEAALTLVRAYDANVDAINGDGHPGQDHDRVLHWPVSAGGVEFFDAVGDCAACGGAQYGSGDAVQAAIAAVKLALGEPLRPYEEYRVTPDPS